MPGYKHVPRQYNNRHQMQWRWSGQPANQFNYTMPQDKVQTVISLSRIVQPQNQDPTFHIQALTTIPLSPKIAPQSLQESRLESDITSNSNLLSNQELGECQRLTRAWKNQGTGDLDALHYTLSESRKSKMQNSICEEELNISDMTIRQQ